MTTSEVPRAEETARYAGLLREFIDGATEE
jgi:hypothetical protein